MSQNLEIHVLNIRLLETEAGGPRQQRENHALHHGAVLHAAGESTQSSLRQARLPPSVATMGLNAKHIVSSFASWRCKLDEHAETLQVAEVLCLILFRRTKRLWVCTLITREARQIPNIRNVFYSKFCVVVAEDLRSYKILQIDLNHGCTHIFAWEIRDGRSPPSFPPLDGPRSSLYGCFVCCVYAS